MLKNEEIELIRKYLEEAKRPLFFFDDDSDGCCSYLLLKRMYKFGAGIVLKGRLEEIYIKKVYEYKPDLIVVLDKPIIMQEFLDKNNVPILWIDHHPLIKRENVIYFNPRKWNEIGIPCTTRIVYEIVKNEKDIWLAVVGCIADFDMPPFLQRYYEIYPDLLEDMKDIETILFHSKTGELVNIINSCLKGTTSDIRRCLNILTKIEDPREILLEKSARGKYLFNKYLKIRKEYNKLRDKALKIEPESGMLIFIYLSLKNSYSAELSTELKYLFPNLFVIVGRKKQEEVIMSLRYQMGGLPLLLDKALVGVKGYGGGHENACGAVVSINDYELFIENLRVEFKKREK